ncbi:MAG TPA: arylesterase [Granulicella sp.]|jgi:acyl-CoA thioesterase-1|nr:arylesterase [Granulicella sp.]
MRQLWLLSILAALGVVAAGCKTDQPARHASQINSRVSERTPATSLNPSVSSANSSANEAPKDDRPLIVCFGDSLTAGYGADPGESYPDHLQADLDARGYAYRVVNEGISGNTTKDAVDRLDLILRLKPALVVVEFGGNDGLRGLPIEQSRANLDLILKRLTASGTTVALAGITLPPNYGPDYIHQFNETYVLLARKYHVAMLPFLLQGVVGIPGMMQADHTHATEAGNKIVAENVLNLITPLLKH